MPDEQHHAAEAGSEPRPSESADAAPLLDRASAKSPLITAVEIENFKGIGRRVRIDLRPITLLFGRNSAGKSESPPMDVGRGGASRQGTVTDA